jgi:hypothetical protein
MPSIRVGLGTDLNIKGGNTGIGTVTPTARLEVVGGIVAERASSGGISTFKEYQGFNQTLAAIPHDTLIDNGECGSFNSLTGEIKIDGETTISSGSTVEVGKIKRLTVTNRFAVPLGETNNRDAAPEAGTTRFNQDFGTLEFFDGANWKTVNSYARGGAAGRALFMGGETPTPAISDITYVNISSLGNTINFGDLLTGRYGGSGMSNSTRGVIAGGWASPANNFDIEYITIASEGSAIDWGINNTGGWGSQGTSSSTRGLTAGGGYPSASATIESIFFSTVGTKEDWGDISAERGRGTTGCNNSTRSVFFGGYSPAPISTIEYKTTASNGDTVFFGELIAAGRLMSGMSSSTRGVIGTSNFGAGDDHIGYITTATTGNAQYFGDLTTPRSRGGVTSNQIRGLYIGGIHSSAGVNTIDYCTISTAGNFVDFGDLTTGGLQQQICVSDSHGGLGGF